MNTNLWTEVREAIRNPHAYPEYRLPLLALDCRERGWRRSERLLRDAIAERVRERVAEWGTA